MLQYKKKIFCYFSKKIMIVLSPSCGWATGGGSRKGLDKTLKTLPAELIDKINFYNLSSTEILRRLAEETYIDENQQVLHLSPSFQFLFPGMQRFSIPLHEFKHADHDESAGAPEDEYPDDDDDDGYGFIGSPVYSDGLNWKVYDETAKVKLGEYDLPPKMLGTSDFLGQGQDFLDFLVDESERYEISDHKNIKFISFHYDHNEENNSIQKNGIEIEFFNVGPYRRLPELTIKITNRSPKKHRRLVGGEIVAYMREHTGPRGLKTSRKRPREE
jgi:hypothetical protein